jgi:hypothetical protein
MDGGLVPGFAADTPLGIDALAIDDDAKGVAALLVSRMVEPPLSIGIFGARGSGKSMFAHRVRQCVDHELGPSGADGDWGERFALLDREVVQVGYDVWHHVGSSHARALVLQIYAALSSHRDGVNTSGPLRQLPTFQSVERRLVDELSATERVARQAEADLAEFERRYDDAANDLSVVAARLKWPAVAERLAEKLGPDGCEALDTAGRHLGITELSSAAESYADVLAKARAVAGRAAILNEATTTRRLARTAGLLAGSLALVALLGLAVYFVAARVENLKDEVSTLVGLFGAIAVVFGVASAVRARIIQDQAATAIESVLSHGRVFDGIVASVDASAQRDSSRADERVRVCRDQVAAARARFTQAQDAAIVAQTECDRLAERDPVHVVAEKYQTIEGDSELGGLVPVMRADLEALSVLFRLGAYDDTENLPHRVIVYIDDLDIAPPRDIVEVLEAIHFLLGFQLFCVVVLADPVVLIGAVSAWFPAVDTSANHDALDDERSAYLRKLLQLMLWLPRLTPTSVEALIRLLVEPSPEIMSSPTAAALPAELPDVFAGSPPTRSTLPPTLTAQERETAFQLAPLMKTPRDARTFVNTYRLARTLLPPDRAHELLDGGYAPLMALLAISLAVPQAAVDLFDQIERGDVARSVDRLREIGSTSAASGDVVEWSTIVASLIEQYPGMPTWTHYARRFTLMG